TYHQEMLPTKLMMTIIQSKQNVPFSTAAEVLGMLAAFELLQEAGLRLPQPSGDTVSIIGALIVGQSAVEAKVVSPVVVIVVAVAGVTGYTMPSQDLGAALRLCRFALTAAAVAAGFFGLMITGVLLVMHLASLECLGTPYLSPLPHGGAAAALRAALRFPLRQDKYREADLRPLDRRNQK
ncbi:MAG: spore germination protein, partial [Oscillospiraceae bacterium]|nr:spore germination protein [Oscillospiraceae bacterium]